MHTTYDYLDLEQFRSLYISQNQRRMKFYVEGIKCSKCIAKIENLKNRNVNISLLEVDLANQTAEVELKDSHNSFGKVAEAISALGFRPVPIQTQKDVTIKWQ